MQRDCPCFREVKEQSPKTAGRSAPGLVLLEEGNQVPASQALSQPLTWPCPAAPSNLNPSTARVALVCEPGVLGHKDSRFLGDMCR